MLFGDPAAQPGDPAADHAAPAAGAGRWGRKALYFGLSGMPFGHIDHNLRDSGQHGAGVCGPECADVHAALRGYAAHYHYDWITIFRMIFVGSFVGN